MLCGASDNKQKALQKILLQQFPSPLPLPLLLLPLPLLLLPLLLLLVVLMLVVVAVLHRHILGRFVA
ncbi:hypothetical protein AWZ03_014584 [Drosophila navojoa]|uniref:Uncharacterized protein n=1 Tax=Drosophila navojoa TaxID=7232 RepID=A0A484ARH4_DRONA|nr:hypothetical protein AWZ03_014584 [Drosophila navojoa]